MLKAIARRLLLSLLVVWLVTVLVFLSTVISFTTIPFTRLSIAHARFCGAMRYIVAHMHRSGASKRITLSGKRC